MNLYVSNRKKDKKYIVKSEAKQKNKPDTSQYNLTKEEVAKDVIDSLNWAQKYLRGEVKGKPLDELLNELDKYVEEERKNGRC